MIRLLLLLLCLLRCAVSDSVTRFSVLYPKVGEVATLPLWFTFDISLDSEDALEEFKTQYKHGRICVEISTITTKCSAVAGTRIAFTNLPAGNLTARAFIWDGHVGGKVHEATAISFLIVSREDFDSHVAKAVEMTREEKKFPPEYSLVQWAELQKAPNQGKTLETRDVFLVIGVKTAVLTNFARRQAIRQTWASRNLLPVDVEVLFLGCKPDFDELSDLDRSRFEAAIDQEKHVYGDLLTTELECRDGRAYLAEKVSNFLEWVAKKLPQTSFVMIADDDIYTRVDGVLEMTKTLPRTGVYLSEASRELDTIALYPVRNAANKYYTSKWSYPLREFPPYAAGPHTLISMDCARFIAKNRRCLRSLSGHDDVSIGLWLLAIQVHPQTTPRFAILRSRPCRDDLLSFANLSPLAIRLIHSNLLQEEQFCQGFDREVWGRQLRNSIASVLPSQS